MSRVEFISDESDLLELHLNGECPGDCHYCAQEAVSWEVPSCGIPRPVRFDDWFKYDEGPGSND